MEVARARSLRAFTYLSFALLGACSNNVETTASDFSNALRNPQAQCESTAVPNQFLVGWKDGSFSVEKAKDREDFIKKMEPYKDQIDFAENDQIIRIEKPPAPAVSASVTTMSDTTTWGQDMVAAPDVWAQGVLGEGVTVAVIDSGVDLTHPQLQNQLYTNPGEIPDNGIDDDDNGLIDDVHGYDFAADTGHVTDGTGHGTHVAGIIAADHNTGSVKGLAPKAKILALDFMNDAGEGQISNAIIAMYYAASQGAKVINASWGGAPCSKNLRNAIQALASEGVLFISASGNGDSRGIGLNLDVDPEYPAAFGLSNQITVGASSSRDYMAGFSNYSRTLVGLLAPGVGIYSTYPGNRIRALDGTSMATPFVSGAVALLMSAHPEASSAQIRSAILDSVDPGNYPVSSGGRLNIKKALTALSTPNP